MSEFKGTPGPWLNAGRSAGSHIHADKGEVAWLLSYMGIPDEEIEANASLIAAAPDLLEALTTIICEMDQWTGWNDNGFEDETIPKARAAIAKALGETK